MKKSNNLKKSKNTKPSKGDFIFLGIIITIVLAVVFIEQLRHYNEKKAERIGIEGVCTIVEVHNLKTELVKYTYIVDGKSYYSDRAVPFSGILPGEKFKLKYLKYKPEINVILFENPIIMDIPQKKVRGYIDKIIKNKEVSFHYIDNDDKYNRWQLLRDTHTFKQGDSVNVIFLETKPEIGIINY